MRHAMVMILAGTAALTAACAPEQAAAPDVAETAAAAIETPAETPKVASTDPLNKVTCAEFLATAEVAAVTPADDAALAAQDELANGLTWLHGYLYATKNGDIEPLTQEWMKNTVKRVYEACSAAEKPAEMTLAAAVAS